MAAAVALGLAGCGANDAPDLEGSAAEFRPSSFYEAVIVANTPLVDDFIARGADVNATEDDGTTLLMRAVNGRASQIAQRLIDAGANVSAANRFGVTALYLAARNSDTLIATALLAAGADPNTALPEGETVLMTAAKNGSTQIVRALLGANPAASASATVTATATAKADSRANPNAKEGWYGQTALMWAAAEGHADVVQALIAGGADLNAVDQEGTSALIFATLNGHLDIAGALLDADADPKLADSYGRTVLFVAVDLNTIDANQRPATLPTATLKPIDIVKLALEHGADPDAALVRGLPSFLAQGVALDTILNAGATPLLRAAMSGDLQMIDTLLAAGANPLAATAERELVNVGANERPANGKTTTLMAAAGVGWSESANRGRESDALKTIQLLLERGADVNAANQSGETALHGATLRGSAAIIQFLADRGANLTAKNAKGYTPLDIATGIPEDGIPYNEATASLLRNLMRNSGHY